MMVDKTEPVAETNERKRSVVAGSIEPAAAAVAAQPVHSDSPDVPADEPHIAASELADEPRIEPAEVQTAPLDCSVR
jgi:hypothetical protein